MAGAGANFKSSDDTNLTEEVDAAFWDKGIIAPNVIAVFGTPAPPSAPPPPMSQADVTTMLDEKAEWKLAVEKGEAVYVLAKYELRSEWDAATGGTVVDVTLRPIAPSEKLLLDAVPKLYAPDVSYERLKEALALPVAQAGLVATAAGLFGLLALRDKMSNPDAMKVAIVFAGFAVCVSLFGRYLLREVTVKPARLDLLEKRHKESIRGPLWRSRFGIALLIVAIVAAIIATFPGSETKDAKATIADPSVTQTAEGITATVKVTWQNLGSSVVKVQTTVRQGDKQIQTQESPTAGEAKVEEELEIKLSRPATIEVITNALDASDDDVGTGSSKRFEVP